MNDKKIVIDGVEYVPVGAVTPKPGKRAVVVIDRGWIYAGDVDEETKPGRILLTRAVWVFRWESIGFNAVIDNPESDKVDLRPLGNLVDIPAGAEVFRVHVPDSWGL